MGFEHWFYKAVIPLCDEGQYWMAAIGLEQFHIMVFACIFGLIMTGYALYSYIKEIDSGIY